MGGLSCHDFVAARSICFTGVLLLTLTILLIPSVLQKRWAGQLQQSKARQYMCVCSLSYVLAEGSSVAFQPHTINMSLWRGRGAPRMLTCGEAPLTTIDKSVRWLLVIKIPGGESYIGGHLTSRLKAVVASFLSGSRLLLKRVICLPRILTKPQSANHTIVYWLTDLGQGQKCT